MATAHGDTPPPSPRADLILAAVFLCLAAAIVAGAAAMPTFTDQGTPLYVAPGIVPGFHGVVLGALSIVLAIRSVLRGALAAPGGGGAAGAGQSVWRIVLAAVLAVAFAAGLVGRIPFWIAATLFVFCFVNAFEWAPGQSRRTRLVNAGAALAIGLATGIGLTLLFERVFLIRMP